MFKSKKIFGILVILALGFCLSILTIKLSNNSITANAETESVSTESFFDDEDAIEGDSNQFEINNSEEDCNKSTSAESSESDSEEIDKSSDDENLVTKIEGNLQWYDDNYKLHPLRKVKIELFSVLNEKGDLELLESTFSDDSGYFIFQFLIENESEFSIKVYAGDGNIIVKYSDDIIYNAFQKIVIAPGETITLNYDFDMKYNLGKAFQISQAAITARDFAQEMMAGKCPSDISIYYPSDIKTSYFPNRKAIYLCDNIRYKNYPPLYASWDVIMHEYGHHIEFELDIIGADPNEHYINANDADNLKDKYQGVLLAWAESWNTVFGMIAQQYYSEKLNNIETVGDSYYTSNNLINYDINKDNEMLGEACEDSIIGVLWDLYDDDYETETNDPIALGFKGFWDVTTESHAKTFSEFINHFYKAYPQYIENIALNLSYFKMAADELTIKNDAYLSWTGEGGSKLYPNNKFYLSFYDKYKKLVFNTQDLDMNTYVLTSADWNKLYSLDGDYFYWSVASFSDYEGVLTGPYISTFAKTTKIKWTSLLFNKDLKVNLLPNSNYYWFRFTAPENGTYTFYSKGYADTTMAELCEQLYLFDRHILASAIGQGDIKHFEFSYALNKSRIVYLRITAPYFASQTFGYFNICVKKS